MPNASVLKVKIGPRFSSIILSRLCLWFRGLLINIVERPDIEQIKVQEVAYPSCFSRQSGVRGTARHPQWSTALQNAVLHHRKKWEQHNQSHTITLRRRNKDEYALCRTEDPSASLHRSMVLPPDCKLTFPSAYSFCMCTVVFLCPEGI